MLIHNAEVTGSLNINNVPFNSGSFSGSFRGDGSQLSGVTGATTASYVEYSNVGNKPALVSGSSQITYSGLSGIPSGIVSGSSQVTYSGLTGIPAGIVSGSDQIIGFGIFATTGSNQFNGSQAVTGSLTVTGQVVAQTLNVQQVTSSIVYSSGSNIFGNTLGNTQQFTGSVSVTGSLTVNGVNYLPLTGGTLTGALNGTSATFSGLVTTNDNLRALQTTTSANSQIIADSDNGSTLRAAVITFGSTATDSLLGILRASNSMLYKDGGKLAIGTRSAQDLVLSTNDTVRLTIASTGAATFSNIVNVGYDSNNRSTIRLTSNAANRQAAIYFYGNNAESSVLGYEGGSEIVSGGVQGDFVIRNVLANKNIILATNNGNVGIDTISPTNKLHLTGNSATPSLRLGSISVGFHWDIGRENASTGDFVFNSTNVSTGTTEKMRVTQDSAAYLRMASGTGGIQFNGDTAAANALDDYEEGTWTPTIEGEGSNPTITYNTRFGFYTKVGRVVTIHCSLQPLTVSVAGTGNLRFGGLPFTSANLSDCLGVGVAATNGNFSWGTNKTSITFSIGQNTSKINVYAQQNGTAETGIPVTNFNNADKYLFFSITYIAT